MSTQTTISPKSRLRVALAMAAAILLSGLAMRADAATTSNTYDSLNRLTKTDYGNGLAINYTYDAAGNRLSQVTTGIAPSIASQPLGQTVVMNQSATLQVSATGTGPLSYQWYQGTAGTTSNPVPGAVAATFTTPALASTSSYWARVTNGAGSADSATAIVTVITPPVIATHPLSTSAPLGGTPTLSVSAAGLSLNYQWFIGQSGDTSRPVLGAVSASYTTPPMSDIVSYWVRVTNPAGSVNSNTATVDSADTDGDGLTDLQEARLTLTDPTRMDTDGDGISDAFEDADGDGLGNLAEIAVYGTNPRMTDSNGDSLSDTYEACVDGTPFAPRVGNQLTLDLKRLANAGETIRLVGKLPTGLKFNATTGLISGTITGKPGTYALSVQVFQGTTFLRTVPLPITVGEFPSSLIGNFDFLLEDANDQPRGAFRLAITKANAWSATLETVGASRRSAKGSFILVEGAPVAPISAVFPAVTGAAAATVNISIDGSATTLTGTYNEGTLRGFRIASGADRPLATMAYSFAMFSGLPDEINVPAGFGWMTGKVSNLGVGIFKGMLGDGTTASLTLRVSASGQAVLWAQPYKNRNSYIGGIVTLGNLGQPVSDIPTLADGVWWYKAADSSTLSYPNGFPAMPVVVGTGKWIAPATATALGASLGWRDNRTAEVIIEGGGLSNQEPQTTSAALPTEFTLDDKFNLAASAPVTSPLVAWKGKVAKTNGAFSGTLTLPAGFSANIPSGSAAVSGVLIQDGSWGSITGCGLIKVPASGAKGSFRTAAILLDQ